MDKPEVDFIEGLSPAVSIDQKSTSRNPRSTVGTITEVYDYLRLLYARAGSQHCPICGEPVRSQTPQQIVDQLMGMPQGTRFQVLAPVVRGRKGEYSDLFRQMQTMGFSRALVDGEQVSLSEPPTLEKNLKHDIAVIVDRLVVKENIGRRLTDSIETALRLASGLVVPDFVDEPADAEGRQRRSSEHRSCPNEHPQTLEEIEPRTFSFNAPYGACPTCSGIGSKLQVDPELVVPDETLTLREGAVAAWGQLAEYYLRMVTSLSEELDFSIDTPWKDLPKSVKKALLHGKNHKVHVRYRNRWGRERRYSTGFEGAIAMIERRHSETESDSSRDRYEGYMREVPCETCDGARLKPEVLAVTVGGVSISQLCQMSISSSKAFLDDLKLGKREEQIAGQVQIGRAHG